MAITFDTELWATCLLASVLKSPLRRKMSMTGMLRQEVQKTALPPRTKNTWRKSFRPIARSQALQDTYDFGSLKSLQPDYTPPIA